MNTKSTAQYVEMLLTRKAPPGPGRKQVTAKIRTRALQLYAATPSIAAVARALSISQGSVRRIIKEAV